MPDYFNGLRKRSKQKSVLDGNESDLVLRIDPNDPVRPGSAEDMRRSQERFIADERMSAWGDARLREMGIDPREFHKQNAGMVRSVLDGSDRPAPLTREDPEAIRVSPEDEALYHQYLDKLTSDDKPLSIGEYMRSTPDQREGPDRPVKGIDSDVASNMMIAAPFAGFMQAGAAGAVNAAAADAASVIGAGAGQYVGGDAGEFVGGLAGGVSGGMASRLPNAASRAAGAFIDAMPQGSKAAQRGATSLPGDMADALFGAGKTPEERAAARAALEAHEADRVIPGAQPQPGTAPQPPFTPLDTQAPPPNTPVTPSGFPTQPPQHNFIRGLRNYPGLSQFTMPDDASMRADKALELVRSRISGAGETWANRVDEIRKLGEENPDLFQTYLKYLDAADFESRVKAAEAAGKPAPKLPTDDYYTNLHQSRQALGLDPNDLEWNGQSWIPASQGSKAAARGFYDKLHGKVESMRDEMWNVAKATGQVKPDEIVAPALDEGFQGPVGFIESQGRENYVPHLIKSRLEDEMRPGMLADTEAENMFNYGAPGRGRAGTGTGTPLQQRGEQTYEGSSRELAGDPLERLGWKGALVERRGMMNQFIDRLKPLEKDTTAPGFKYDRNTMGTYDLGGGRIAVYDRPIAEALSDASTVRDPGMIQKFLGMINNVARKGLLKYNPSFQAKQIADDLASAMLNVPYGYHQKYLQKVVEHGETILNEFSKVNRGEFSPVLAAYRRSGAMNEVYESLVDTQGEVKQLSEKLRGGHNPGPGKWLDEMGLARETAAKAAYADVMKEAFPDITDERAMSLANQVMGDYISRSKTGRELGEFFPMMKWYANAVKRLSLAALEDPVTATRNPLAMSGDELARAGKTTPWGKILPMAVAATLWNRAVAGRSDFDGLIVPGTNQKIVFPGVGGLLSGDKSMEWSVKGLLDRASPGVNVPVTLITGQSLSGKQASPFTYPVPRDVEARETARRGGIGLNNPTIDWAVPDALGEFTPDIPGLLRDGNLTPEAQRSVESFAAIPGMVRRATSGDSSFWEKLGSIGKSLSPIQVQDVEAQDRFGFRRNKDDLVRAFREAKTPEEKNAIVREWIDGGGTGKDLVREIRGGITQETIFKALTPKQRDLRRRSK